jgi:Mu transposase-like protein
MVTDRLFRRLRKLIQTEDTLANAADKAGVDEKTARKYRDADTLPSQQQAPHTWRTREDPGRFPDVQLRTLQRRIKQWRALEGPPKEVFFAQTHEPGRLAESDFTQMNELGVTIAGEPFDHLVYHFVLTYSNWEAGTVCFSESFESLSEGLQNALWELGGVPRRHRTDRLTAAVNSDSDSGTFTGKYQALLAHYGLEAQAIQPRKANQNGDVEQSHYRFKQAVDQALMLRGSRDFAGRGEYQVFLRRLMAGRNANRKARFAEELAALSSLPARRLEMARRVKARVDPGSTIHVGGNTYSLPSRLVGEFVDVHVGAETLDIWHGARKVDTLPRLRGRGKHRVEYRHVIDWLVRKPGAFEEYRYRDAMFPTSRFRMAYDVLVDRRPGRAVKDYLAILHLAAREGEVGVDEALRLLLEEGRMPDGEAVADALRQGLRPPAVTDVLIVDVDLTMYDRLLEPGEDYEHSINRHEGAIDGEPEGAAPAGDAGLFRGAGATSPAGVAELRALPAGADGTGDPGAARPPDRAAPAGVAAAAGEGPPGAGPEAATAESGAADPGADGRSVRGPLRERAGVREPGFGEDARIISDLSRVDPFRKEGLFPELWADGSGPAGGQAGPEAEPLLQESLTVRGPGA